MVHARPSSLSTGSRSLLTTFLTLAILLPQLALADFFGSSTDFLQPAGVHVTKLTVTMKVPAIPANNLDDQTLFIWPGVQPGNALNENGGDPANIGNGVLQPVLTWGPSCAPNTQPTHQWWISGQYVNTLGENPDFQGCFGGEIMALSPGDLVKCTIALTNASSATWEQTCINTSNRNDTITFTFNLEGQKQTWGEIIVETTSTLSKTDWNFPVFFYNMELITDKPMPSSGATCVIAQSGSGWVARASALSKDGLSCTLGGVGFYNPEFPAPNITDADLTI